MRQPDKISLETRILVLVPVLDLSVRSQFRSRQQTSRLGLNASILVSTSIFGLNRSRGQNIGPGLGLNVGLKILKNLASVLVSVSTVWSRLASLKNRRKSTRERRTRTGVAAYDSCYKRALTAEDEKKTIRKTDFFNKYRV